MGAKRCVNLHHESTLTSSVLEWLIFRHASRLRHLSLNQYWKCQRTKCTDKCNNSAFINHKALQKCVFANDKCKKRISKH